MSQTERDLTAPFFKVLAEDLKFEDASAITSAKAKRLFDNPSIAPFLKEFAQTVTKYNILSREQIAKYKHLWEQGKAKAGTELQRSMLKSQARNAACESRNTEFDGRIEKAQLKKRRLEFELKKIKELKDKRHLDLDKINGLALESTNNLKEKKNETRAENDKLREVISTFPAIHQDLCNIVKKSYSGCCLLSQFDLKELLQAEETYNAHLTRFVKKQFFQISQTITADLNQPESVHTMCNLTDSNLLWWESEETKREIAADIKRAKHCLPDHGKKIISAEALESSAEVALFFLQEKRSQNAESSDLCTSEMDMRQSLEGTVKKQKEIKKELEQFTKVKIPDLISQGTPLQTTHLLTGDYLRKRVRQDYFLERQQRVMSLLELQRNRLDLLWVLLQVEEVNHNEAGKQISILLKQLKSMLNESVAELKWFEANEKRELLMTQGTAFHLTDKVITAILNILGVKSEDSSLSFVSCDKLPRAAAILQKQLSMLWKYAAAAPNPDEVCMNNLSSAVRECESLLLACDVNDRGDGDHVVLTPELMRKMMNKLQKAFDQLSSLLLNSCKEIESRKRVLEYDKKAAVSRDSWVDFYSQ